MTTTSKAPVVIHNGEIVGTNDIIVDNMLLAYRIGVDSTPPTIVCPDPLTLDCGTPVDLRSRVTATDDSGDPVTIIQTPAPGTLLPVGTHTVTFVGEDGAGNRSEPCSTTVTIVDSAPPTIANVQTSPSELAVTGQLVPVTIVVQAADNCDSTVSSRIISVSTNDNQPGVHWAITGPLTLNVRAVPRVYVITVESVDDAGNPTHATTTVTVKAN